jgi:adenosylcobinamide-phosphate synthase
VPIAVAAARPVGLALGVLADAVLGDPRRYHPVAGFGRAVTALERRWYADDVRRGAAFTAVAVGVPVALGILADRATARSPVWRAVATAAVTWSVVGSASLAGEGGAMAGLLEAGDLEAARRRLSHLCARDPSGMGAGDLARATIESLAENASDAVVAPLLWGAVAGAPGLAGYRAVNTLDAMIGYRSPRYLRFGRAAARLDDAVNLVPARLAGALVALVAPATGGSATGAWRTMRRDGSRHPSPNAGRPEAAVAGALGLSLGGRNRYAGYVEERPSLGDGAPPQVADVRRAVSLGRSVTVSATVVATALASGLAAARGSWRRAGGLSDGRPGLLPGRRRGRWSGRAS